jgi:phosphate starvation-inducible PhoH-like protein
MKKNIDISGVDPLAFVGPSDKNIKEITKKFDSKIVVRGNSVLIDGDRKEIIVISSLIKSMLSTINQKGFVDSDDVTSLMNISFSSDNGSIAIDNDKHIILYTHKGIIAAHTNGQIKYFDAILNNDIVFAIGPAGTGKTYQAVASAAAALKRKEVERIIITRPAVEAGERLGFLPGDLREKVDPYLTPLYDALNNMMPRDKLKIYLGQRTIEIAPLAYMRGRTLHNSFIILDEAQNATPMQMKMFLTRLGVTSKAIITGDIKRIDLPVNDQSGLIDAANILKKVTGISFVDFDETDVVRHKLVKNIIKAYAKNDSKKL